jgi:hypothetical protein
VVRARPRKAEWSLFAEIGGGGGTVAGSGALWETLSARCRASDSCEA